MVLIQPPLPAALSEDLELFCTVDELLSSTRILAFYGPSATTTSITSTSRIQVHIFSPAGLQSYPRLIVSPNSPLYAAVSCLAREEQGDEICRGLAFSLYKYFSELPQGIRDEWERQSSQPKLPSAPELFSEQHAAMVASRMVKVENVAEIVVDVKQSLAEQTVSWLDVDVVLPPGTVRRLADHPRESLLFNEPEREISKMRYGELAPIVDLFGNPAFLPTAKLRRAPSKPTSLNRSLSFLRKQKEDLRREMCELLDTEESYVGKIDELVHVVAEEFRHKARERSGNGQSPGEEALKNLFPPSLDQILDVNTKFLNALRHVVEETENDAIADIENANEVPSAAAYASSEKQKDPTGVTDLANCLVAWLPSFSECYTDYIHAHAEFPNYLKSFQSDLNSSFSRRVQDTGEQRLTSMLIEPVQRLPRYSLYLDNLSKQLPARHPAIKNLLKAKDIISDICAQESPASQQSKILVRLQKMISSWPMNLAPNGRLITGVDILELFPPFRISTVQSRPSSAIFLLFTDCLVVVQKIKKNAVSARGLLAEVDNLVGSAAMEGGDGLPDLMYHEHFSLTDITFSEVDNGKLLQLICPPTSFSQRQRTKNRTKTDVRTFHLSGGYDSKAAKFMEEFVKARVEGRFSEVERDGHKWEVRSVSNDLNLFTAVFEEGRDAIVEGRGKPAAIRIHVDPSQNTRILRVGEETVELTGSLTVKDDDFYLLELEGANDYGSRDQMTSAEFLPVLSKRLSNWLQSRNNIRDPSMTSAFFSRNNTLLSSLKVRSEGAEDSFTSSNKQRPHSPVKLLSKFFSGDSTKDPVTPRKLQKSGSGLSDTPRILPTPSSLRPSSKDGEITRPQSAGRFTIGSNTPGSAVESITKLEETFATYLLALHSRKGNVVGRTLRMRGVADALAVNELYNSLLENPLSHQLAAQAPVDVLFAAFEKFLRVAWSEKMGPVLAESSLLALQNKSDAAYPGEFEEFFKETYNQLSPQNQRAIHGVINLLADLLDGTSNDGDRGILTASFAEVLAPEGNAHNFIPLFDRFVEDVEALFITRGGKGASATNNDSITSESRGKLGYSGSINSSQSSLRKRFGLGALSRENSKNEHESKLGSVLRTLSKTGRSAGDSQPSSMNKPPSLGRSNSMDTDIRLTPKRPVSRDRPTVLGAFNFEENQPHPGRSFLQLSNLETIGEISKPPPRKKRRSSLSDLKALQTGQTTPTWSPQPASNVETPQPPTRQYSASPRTPSSRPATSSSNVMSPTTRIPSPTKKENMVPVAGLRQQPARKPAMPSSKKEDVTITSRSPAKRRSGSVSASSIPTRKGLPGQPSQPAGLMERPTSGNSTKAPVDPSATVKPLHISPTKKLKMQSPRKLHERLQKEQKAVDTASESLQAELSKIGEEISALSARPPRTARQGSPVRQEPGSITLTALSKRLSALESRIPTLIAELNARTQAINSDLDSSLLVSEARVKNLEGELRDRNAENEVLYSKFNEELIKILRAVRAGEGADEAKRKVKELGDEVGVLKKENARLRRETGGLRAQLRE